MVRNVVERECRVGGGFGDLWPLHFKKQIPLGKYNPFLATVLRTKGTKVGLKEENRHNMNMLVVNGRPDSRSTGARSTTLVPVLQKNIL